MARISWVQIFAPDEFAIVHCINRAVRRCYLLGDDPITGKDFDHRKAWMELVRDFGKLFRAVAGKPRLIDSTRSPRQQQRCNTHSRTRELRSELGLSEFRSHHPDATGPAFVDYFLAHRIAVSPIAPLVTLKPPENLLITVFRL